MNEIHWKLGDRFRSQWVKVKFYKEKPDLKEGKRLEGVKFCEATKEAVLGPIILDRKSISCPGARYAFGWDSDLRNSLLDRCGEKRKTERRNVESMLERMPYLKEPFNYIGLNSEGEPDLVLSYIAPEKVMDLIKVYSNHNGEDLDISLYSMMSICGGVAVRTYLEGKISISFGCDDARKYADIRRENLAVGIPNKLFKVFVS